MLFAILIVVSKIFIYIGGIMHSDYCLEAGICPEGREIKVNGDLIKISKETCIKNNGVWREDKNHNMKVCRFNDD